MKTSTNAVSLSQFPDAIATRAVIDAIYAVHRASPTKESLDCISELSRHTLECVTRFIHIEPHSDFERSVRRARTRNLSTPTSELNYDHSPQEGQF